MKPYHRLSFVVPVLMAAGTLSSIWSYHERGISGLRISAGAWLIALIAAILLNIVLRRFRQGTGQHGGDEDNEEPADTNRFLMQKGDGFGLAVFAVGAGIAGYTFGFVTGVTVTLALALMTFLYHHFATRQKTRGQ